MQCEQIEPSAAATTSRIRGHNAATIAIATLPLRQRDGNVKFVHLSTVIHSQRWTYIFDGNNAGFFRPIYRSGEPAIDGHAAGPAS